MRIHRVSPKEHDEFYVVEKRGFTWVIWPGQPWPQSVTSLEEALKRYGFEAKAVACDEVPRLSALDRLASIAVGWNWPLIFGG